MRPILTLTLILLLQASSAEPSLESAAQNPAEAKLSAQRSAFRDAYAHAEKGDEAGVAEHLDLLADYILLPDLEAAIIRANLKKASDYRVETFLATHNSLPVAAEVRRKWLNELARKQRWSKYLEIYTVDESTTRRCHMFTARIATGKTRQLADEILPLWLVGKSQPDACDLPFKYLDEVGYLTEARKRKRFEMAIADRNLSLARFLAGSLDWQDRDWAARWQRMRSNPTAELRQPTRFKNNSAERELILFGFHRLARQDPLYTAKAWLDYRTQFDFSAAERNGVSRKIAVWAARKHLPDSAELLAAVPARARNLDVREWQVRTALRNRDWAAVYAYINELPGAERDQEMWRYWRGRALQELGQNEAADAVFRGLAKERDYYGFLAADQVGLPYRFEHRPIVPDTELLTSLADRPALKRARELYEVGQHGRARSEWNRQIAGMSASERAQAALIAHQWGWASRAIAAASVGSMLDDLEIRFPTPYREIFAQKTDEANIAFSWAYGIARSESLFMPDVSSSAGAIGLMQLMPATGRQVARSARLKYRNQYSLLDPELNITLGTKYLGRMYERFGGNQVLATAAYNAGPHRVSRWLPEDGEVIADVWVDTIPFTETRGYVRRVLSSQVIFTWRITGSQQRLAELMPPVTTAEQLAKLTRL
ncbi:MAG: transglycosylase SLT domain-containing protein [Gammaproteobacteria bacterium]|nr:transglycosylase SLT domain-containing protein [Gammaproteobacteria bacterium]